jgi:hypothetical protein
LGDNPEMMAEIPVTVVPVTMGGTPATEFPYAVVRPYSNDGVVDVVLAFIVPFKVALVAEISVAAVVTTVGAAFRIGLTAWLIQLVALVVTWVLEDGQVGY